MSAKVVIMGALFSQMRDVADLHYDGEVVWAASTGGVEVFDLEGSSLARLDDLPGRRATAIHWLDDSLVVGTEGGAYAWSDQGWSEVGPRTPVVAVTELGIVYRDGGAWPEPFLSARLVDAVAWEGHLLGFTADGRMLTEVGEVQLPGPVADVEVVDGQVRIALHMAAAIWDDSGLQILPIPATAAGAVWGTSDGAVVDDSGTRIGGVPAAIDEIRAVDGQLLLATDDGVWSLDDQVDSWAQDGICDNFITGITRHQGELVVSTFNGGACVFDGEIWRELELPSTMANDVLSDGEDLWVATAEGLVRVGEGVFTQVEPDKPRAHPGTNHDGINALAMGPDGLWVADVLGPVQVEPWRRYRWHVSGHSYQSIAACPTGEVWVGSEDDGLAVRGVELGSRNGRSSWRHVGRLDGLPEDWVMAVACAGEGAAWVGTYRNGVGLMDEDGWTPILEDAWVQFLLVDGDGLWIGTADGLFFRSESGVEKILDEDVHALYREEDRLWVGTRSGLLSVTL